jgi:hypothetical protein
VQAYSGRGLDEEQGPYRRRIGEFAEIVVPHRQVGDQRLRPLSAPLTHEGGERARTILVGETGKASSPEILFLAFDRCREAMAAEAARGLPA